MADILGSGAAVFVIIGYLIWMLLDKGRRLWQPARSPRSNPELFPEEKQQAFRELRAYLPPAGMMQLVSGEWVGAGWSLQRDDRGHPIVMRMDVENVWWYRGEIYDLLPGQTLQDEVSERANEGVGNNEGHARGADGQDNWYEVLDLPETASATQVKDAYLRLARVTHPDNGGSAALFRRVRDAYETLSDPVRRTAYDSELRTQPRLK